MKLFVWQGDGVLQDYTHGMIVAVAPDLESAIMAIGEACSYAEGNYPLLPTEVFDIDANTQPKAWTVWGGG